VEPLLYHTIAVEYSRAIDGYPIFTWDALLHALRFKPPSFFHDSVRNLCILVNYGSRANVSALLAVYTGVENLLLSPSDLGCEYSTGMASLMASLPLTHLSGFLEPMFPYLPPTHSLFSRITHLELRSAGLLRDGMKIGRYLSLVTCLTHLSFDDSAFIPLVSPLLKTHQSLRVLVCIHRFGQYGQLDELASDPRFVFMWVWNHSYLLDWQMGAHGGGDYWSCAEDSISRRQAGEMDGAHNFHCGFGACAQDIAQPYRSIILFPITPVATWRTMWVDQCA
jgi:hypothetical protein